MALHVYVTEGEEFFVAEDIEQAKKLIAEFMRDESGITDSEEISEIVDAVRKMSDDKILAIEEDNDVLTKKTCSQWALEHGPGFLFADCG